MVKLLSVLVSLGFVAFWIYKNIRRVKATEIEHIPTGVSRWTYGLVGLFLFISPLVIAGGFHGLDKALKEEKKWVKTDARVIAHYANGTRNGRTLYQSEVEFTDTQDRPRTEMTESASASPSEVGSTVVVRYDPNDPSKVTIDKPILRWAIIAGLFVMGVFVLFFAGGAAFQVMRLQATAQKIRDAQLRHQAHIVNGRLVGSKKNLFLSLKNADSWRLLVQYRDVAGREYKYESEPIWDYNPEGWARADVAVPVSIDIEHPEVGSVRIQDYFLACKTIGTTPEGAPYGVANR